MANYIIEVENLYYKYCDGTQALDGLSLKIEKGKKIAILGANGAGKSTLFLHLNGILKPQKGKITFNSNLKNKIGIVFQDPDSQLFSASVYQDVSFGPLNLKLPKETVKKLVDEAMQSTEITEFKNKPTHFLSYGEKKRVSIAGVVAMMPEVIIFDEPTEFLDPKHRDQIINLINKLNNDGLTILMSTHDVNLAYEWADYIILLDKGRTLIKGEPDYIFSNPEYVERTNLKMPLILDIYYDLVKNKVIPEGAAMPRNKEELTELIRLSPYRVSLCN